MSLSDVLKINLSFCRLNGLTVNPLGQLVLLTSLLLAGCVSSDTGQPQKCPENYTVVELNQKNWKTEYTGNKKVFQEGVIYLEPHRVYSPQHTDAALVLSRFDIVSENYDIIVDYKNLAALRLQNPNPWEVFWLFFNYVPGPQSEKTANYVVAKPNGIEMGRAAKIVDQAYVKTSDSPKATFNKWHRLRVHRIGEALKIYFNEEFVFQVSGNQIFTASGKIGLYSEDAAVVIKQVCLNSGIQLRR